jgi:hypothetical protein
MKYIFLRGKYEIYMYHEYANQVYRDRPLILVSPGGPKIVVMPMAWPVAQLPETKEGRIRFGDKLPDLAHDEGRSDPGRARQGISCVV